MKHLVLITLLASAAFAGDDKKVAMPAEWSRCELDADCTYASLGCCDTTPVARTHAKAAQQRLNDSGRAWCSPKAACGPGADGTWAGTPGRCVKKACAPPK